MEEFKSVVDLVRKKPTPAEKYPLFYQVENRNLDLDSFVSQLNHDSLDRLQDYDGRLPFLNDPSVKAIQRLLGYAELRWSQEKVVTASLQWGQENEEFVKEILLQELSLEDLESITQMSNEELFLGVVNGVQESFRTSNPSQRIMLSYRQQTLMGEVYLRGLKNSDMAGWHAKRTLQFLKQEFYSSFFLKPLMEFILTLEKAANSQSPLGNYKAGENFEETLSLFLKKTFNLSLPKTGLSVADRLIGQINRHLREWREDSSNADISIMAGVLMEMARGCRVPLENEMVFDLTEKARQEAGLKVGGSTEVTQRPISWKEIFERRRVTVDLRYYPSAPDWLDDELKILDRIEYQGLSVYDLAVSTVQTVTFFENFVKAEMEKIFDAIPGAQAIYKVK